MLRPHPGTSPRARRHLARSRSLSLSMSIYCARARASMCVRVRVLASVAMLYACRLQCAGRARGQAAIAALDRAVHTRRLGPDESRQAVRIGLHSGTEERVARFGTTHFRTDSTDSTKMGFLLRYLYVGTRNHRRWLSTAHTRSAHLTGWLRPRSELFHAVRSSTYIVGRRRPTFRREADRDFRIIKQCPPARAHE